MAMTQPSKPSPGQAKRSKAKVANASSKPADTGSGIPSSSAAAATGPSGSAAGAAKDNEANAYIIEEAEATLEGEPVEAEEPPDAEKVAQALAEAAEWRDKFVRLHAEWDTYRRRTTDRQKEEKIRANEKLVTSLLPVIDDFERTIDYATKNGEKGLFDGVKAVRTKLIDVLVRDGVEVLDPKGEAFDALEAQAVATVDDASVPDETVAEVYQKGYKMGTKVLRPAMVTVTTGGPKREADPDADGQSKGK